MKLLRTAVIISTVGLLLLADAWVVAKYVLGGPVRTTVVDGKPGQATVRFEKAPLGRVDYFVLGAIAAAHVPALALIRASKRRRARSA